MSREDLTLLVMFAFMAGAFFAGLANALLDLAANAGRISGGGGWLEVTRLDPTMEMVVALAAGLAVMLFGLVAVYRTMTR